MQLTIITINYNNAPGLQKTMESVMAQTSKEFEYIVVDGASADGSTKIIEQINPLFTQQFKWISESDSGIYNAMNKGISMATGDYVHFLNSGDWLVDEYVVENMLKALTPACDILLGNVIQVRADGKKRYCKSDNNISLFTFYKGTIQHTSAYIRKGLFDIYGLYDESLRIVSDWKWYLQVAGLNKANIVLANVSVTYFDMTGISSTNAELDKSERRKVLEELVPSSILDDYDKFNFDIDQMQRLKKHLVAYKSVYLLERVLFKFEKWKLKYFSWR